MAKLIFRVLRILVYVVLIAIPSMEYMWTSRVAQAVVMTVAGLVGLFLEIYYVGNKKDEE